jgi:hypothetical protein
LRVGNSHSEGVPESTLTRDHDAAEESVQVQPSADPRRFVSSAGSIAQIPIERSSPAALQ